MPDFEETGTPPADVPASAGEDLRRAPRRFGALRSGFFRAAERLLVTLGGRRHYRRRHLRRGRFVEREERVRVPGLPSALEGFTIAQLSDLHAGPFLGKGDLAQVVEAVNQRRPDVLVLTGDVISHHWSEALLVADDLGRIEAPHGRYAVFGNHDYKDRCESQIQDALEARGFRFLRNDSARLAVADATVALVGIEDIEESREIDLERARQDLSPGDVEIVLCHNPRAAPAIVRASCPLILSGHTHGTQVDLPWFRRLGPEHPGLRVDFGPTTLIVNRGLGVVGAPVRYRVPAEVVYCTLVPAR